MNRMTTARAISQSPEAQAHGGVRFRFASSSADLDAVLRLRFEVFNVELNEGLAASWRSGRDEDQFDAQCDHLLIEDTTGAVIGTYRVQTWEMAREGLGFYSAGEFDLAGMPVSVREKSAEVGRACIAGSHRGRQTLFLLWRGLAAYLEANAKRYLFGCCSLTSQDPAVGLQAFDDLRREGHLHDTVRIAPWPASTCVRDTDADAPIVGRVTRPILFETYLRYGAKVCGPPAMDRAFGTIDFLTLLDVADLSPAHRRMFF